MLVLLAAMNTCVSVLALRVNYEDGGDANTFKILTPAANLSEELVGFFSRRRIASSFSFQKSEIRITINNYLHDQESRTVL